jgi:arylsulfatase A-like enzyme
MKSNPKTRREFLKLMGSSSLLLAGSFLSCNRNTSKRPNIIIIVGDDIGFSDIGCYGSEINTPNLDKLAENGIRFSHFYNMAKCNPTRSSLLTGLYKGDERAISFTQLLRDAGYTTITSGKEHFDKWVPQHCYAKNSFDKSFTFWASTEYFIPPKGEFRRPFFIDGKQLKVDEINCRQKPFYKTDVITDYALDWLDEPLKEKKPFFLFLAYHVAHYPLQAREEDIQKYRGKYKMGWDKIRQERFDRMKQIGIIDNATKLSHPEDNVNQFRGHPNGFDNLRKKFSKYSPWDTLTEKKQEEYGLEMAVFAAMIDRMDQNIGRVIKKLEDAGVRENTLILFFSDNGSCPYDSNKDFNIPPGGADSYRCLRPAWANVGNTPYRLYKQFGHEGGCNTHFIANWPKTIKQPSFTDQPGHVADIFPTLLDICSLKYPEEYQGSQTIPLHGKSLLPIFKGKEREEPEFFISGYSERFRMFRQGDWKIVKMNNGEWELYNLKDDPTELNNLTVSMPDKVIQLEKKYETFYSQLRFD